MRKGMLVGITAAATAAVVGTGAWVAGAHSIPVPPPKGATTVCVNKRTGDVRFLYSFTYQCKRGEDKIVNWSHLEPVPANRVDRLSTLVMVEDGAVKKCVVRTYSRRSGVLAVSWTSEEAPATSPPPSASPSTPYQSPSPTARPSLSTSPSVPPVVSR